MRSTMSALPLIWPVATEKPEYTNTRMINCGTRRMPLSNGLASAHKNRRSAWPSATGITTTSSILRIIWPSGISTEAPMLNCSTSGVSTTVSELDSSVKMSASSWLPRDSTVSASAEARLLACAAMIITAVRKCGWPAGCSQSARPYATIGATQ